MNIETSHSNNTIEARQHLERAYDWDTVDEHKKALRESEAPLNSTQSWQMLTICVVS
jgi:hypothetical protein